MVACITTLTQTQSNQIYDLMELNFPVLGDPNNILGARFGIGVQAPMFKKGKTAGIKRGVANMATLVIDTQGTPMLTWKTNGEAAGRDSDRPRPQNVLRAIELETERRVLLELQDDLDPDEDSFSSSMERRASVTLASDSWMKGQW